MRTEPVPSWPFPGSPGTALIHHPGPRVSETVHALLAKGLQVTVTASTPDAPLRDLAGRGLLTLARPGSVDLEEFDLVVRDAACQEAATYDTVGEATCRSRGVGEVVLVGGGPGSLGLLTLAAAEALRRADVVVYDRLAPLAALDLAPAGAERVPVGKIPRGEATPQEQINAILVERARRGATVVRLKGGDSFVFGRGGEEWLACASAGVPVRVIPGVTSAVAVPALAGVPVTHREVTPGFVVVSGHVGPDDPRSQVDWAALAGAGLTIVVLMGVATLGVIAEHLVGCGLSADTPAAVVSAGGLPSQRSVRAPLVEIAEAAGRSGLGAPAVAVIGPTVDVLEEIRNGPGPALAQGLIRSSTCPTSSTDGTPV